MRFAFIQCSSERINRVALFFSAASVQCEYVPNHYLILISVSQLSGAFSGLLAAAIQKMDGIGGKAGWAWIFILVSPHQYLDLDGRC